LTLAAENEKLKKIIQNSIAGSGANSQISVPASTTGSAASSWATKAASAPVSAPKRKSGPAPLKKRIAAARAFQSPETKGPQRFKYMYLGRSRKINRSKVRSRLRRSGVDTGRILDISFPASGVLGVLMHVQYLEDFSETMTTVGAQIIDDFDPLHPDHLADPKYVSLTDDARAQKMHSLVNARALDTLSFLRPLLVGSVARAFEDLG
jgi:hypothetical protein